MDQLVSRTRSYVLQLDPGDVLFTELRRPPPIAAPSGDRIPLASPINAPDLSAPAREHSRTGVELRLVERIHYPRHDLGMGLNAHAATLGQTGGRERLNGA